MTGCRLASCELPFVPNSVGIAKGYVSIGIDLMIIVYDFVTIE
ncbi:hypothetical protein ACLBWZ_04965 [Brucellaceae bacterium C25G]